MSFYAFHTPESSGIVSTWDECKKKVHKVSNAKYQKFSSHVEALEYLQKNNQNPIPPIKQQSQSPPKELKRQNSLRSDRLSELVLLSKEKKVKKDEFEKPQNCTLVWTDGACSDNQDATKARAGLGVYFGPDSALNLSEPLSSNERHTNNRAELKAIIRAIEIKPNTNLLINTDSRYASKGVNEWMKKWKLNNWMSSKRQPVENQDLWKRLDELLNNAKNDGIFITFKWVKGHATNKGNIEADKLAKLGIQQ